MADPTPTPLTSAEQDTLMQPLRMSGLSGIGHRRVFAAVERIVADRVAAARADERERIAGAVREWWVEWFPADAELHPMHDDFEAALAQRADADKPPGSAGGS